MCSIVASKSLEKLKELAALNSYRGTHSHSVFAFNRKNYIVYAHKAEGEINWETGQPQGPQDLHEKEVYWIAHQQAPTTDSKSMQSIHPAFIDGRFLWHNGIIKDKEVKRLQELYDTTESWDTHLLLRHINETGNVDGIDGTFACLGFAEGFVVFRNEISPLFYNADGDISSTKFEGSEPIPANKIFSFDPWGETLLTVKSEFATKENPYFFGNPVDD